jgi:hypothetical protein
VSFRFLLIVLVVLLIAFTFQIMSASILVIFEIVKAIIDIAVTMADNAALRTLRRHR